MSHIKTEHLVSRKGVSEIQLMASYNDVFASYTEELGLYGVSYLFRRVFGCKDLIQGLDQKGPMPEAVDGLILESVGNPYVVHRRSLLIGAEEIGDFPGSLYVFYPELPYPLVLAGNRKPSVGLGMGKAGAVKIDRNLVRRAPRRPAAKLIDAYRIPVDKSIAELTVARVKVEPMIARYERVGPIQIVPKLLDVSSLAGVCTRHVNAPAGQATPSKLEAADIVSLPAMKAELCCCKCFQCLVYVDAQIAVSFSWIHVLLPLCDLFTMNPFRKARLDVRFVF